MPTVARLSITPVKGLALIHPDEVTLGPGGVAENRRFYLVRPGGRLFSGLHHGPLARVRPAWDPETRRLGLSFPDGEVVEGTVELDGEVETDFWGDHTVRGRLAVGPWAEALTAYVGKPLHLVESDAPSGASDLEPVSLVSTASVEELARRAGVQELDERRFRMLVTVGGCPPHAEDGWIGSRVRAGEALLRVVRPCSRCATTTRDPSTGRRDLDAVRVIKAYRGARRGKYADFGVYAKVEEPGIVRLGDVVEPV